MAGEEYVVLQRLQTYIEPNITIRKKGTWKYWFLK